MVISEILMKIPWQYSLAALLLSLFYGIRGIMEQRILYRQNKLRICNETSPTERIIILYIQDFLFKFIATMSGFVALFICGHLFPTTVGINDISAGKALLLIFLFVWGVTSICGYLTHFIVSAKIPGIE